MNNPILPKNTRQSRLNELLSTSRNKSYFVAAITVFFVIAMVIMGILPAYSAFALQGEENKKRQEVASRLEKKINTLRNMVTEQDDNKDLVLRFENIFPSDPGQTDVFNDLKSLTAKAKVSIQNLAFTELKNNQDLVKVLKVEKQVKAQTVSLLVDGALGDLNSFISLVEQNRRIFNIKSIVIGKKSEQEMEGSDPTADSKLDMQIEFYYYDNSTVNSIR